MQIFIFRCRRKYLKSVMRIGDFSFSFLDRGRSPNCQWANFLKMHITYLIHIQNVQERNKIFSLLWFYWRALEANSWKEEKYVKNLLAQEIENKLWKFKWDTLLICDRTKYYEDNEKRILLFGSKEKLLICLNEMKSGDTQISSDQWGWISFA